MALITDLVKELAASTGTEEKSVAVIARWLREDGLLSQKGRGRGAAKATPLDAARLLIALMIGGKLKNAPQVVRDFGQMIVTPNRRVEPKTYNDKLIEIENSYGLHDEHIYETGLAATISVLGDESKLHTIEKSFSQDWHGGMFFASLTDQFLSGSIYFGYRIFSYRHPFILLSESAESEELNCEAKSSISARDSESDSMLRRNLLNRYRSGILSNRTAYTPVLQSLGEVVADLREPGLGFQDDTSPPAFSDLGSVNA